MRAVVAIAVLLVAGCAGPRPERVQERPSGLAHPEPDPACHGIVAQSPALRGIEQVTLQVTLTGPKATVDVLAPPLSPAEAEEVRRAFAACAWRPGEHGARAGAITFTFTRR